METNKLIAGIVAAAIAIIVLAGVLMPALSNATTTETTFTNEGWFRMSQYDTTTDHVISWTYEKPNIITVDNEDVTIGYNISNGQCTVIANTVWLLRYNTDSDGNPSSVVFLYGSSGTKAATVQDEQTATITLTGGSASVSVGTYTGTHSYDTVYVPDNDGQFTMKKSDKIAYINGDSPIYGFGLTRIKINGGVMGSPGAGFAFIGSYDDGITGSVWRSSNDTTVSDCVCVASEDTTHLDLYKFDKITATATHTDTVDEQTVTTDTELTYNMVIVPYQVTSERAVHLTDSMNVILNVIPIIIIVAVLFGVVAVFILRRE